MSEPVPDPTVKSEPGPDADIPPPTSDYDALLTRLQESPHDSESWKRLIDLAETADKNTADNNWTLTSKAYDALLQQYPNTAAAQVAYIRLFFDDFSGEAGLKRVENLLNRFLRFSPHVEIWKLYLSYVRKTNQAGGAREIFRKAFDYVLNHIGQDRDSGSIWAEYIQFLHAADTTSTWEEGQKMEALRKVYHRAVQIPLSNVEKLWGELESFEMGLNKITAKKFMQDLTPGYMQARSTLRQLTTYLQGLGLHPPPDPSHFWLPSPPTFSKDDRPLIGRWKTYLKWEEGNPLAIEEKDRANLILRIQLAYRKAVIWMRYYPEIWFMAFSWTASVGRTDEAVTILKAGLEANPDSFVLTFAYAEHLEKTNDFPAVHAEYERFFGVLAADLSRLSTAAAAATAASETKAEFDDLTLETNGSETTNGVETTPTVNADQERLNERKKEYTNAQINYMRFARRAQGFAAYRAAFGKARRDEFCSWEVFESAALTEYRCNFTGDGRDVAGRIFETGMKKFGTDVDFVEGHLSFLLTINDENNARALFERVIGTFTPQQARPLWERWSRFQYQYETLEAVLKLEARMAEIYPNDPPIKRFAQRHASRTIDAIAEHDLGVAMSRKQVSANIIKSTGSYPPSSSFNQNGSGNGSGNPLSPTNSFSIPNPNPNPNKRPPPPPDRKRENDYKRPRPDDRTERRRYSPPPPPPAQSGPSTSAWERDRDNKPPLRRDVPPPPRDDKPVTLPPILHRFIAQLPPAETFNGPVFNVENLMDKLKTAVIPSTSARARSPPPPPRASGRPPPDYSPYQGPGSMPTRRGRY
ncbi:Suf-domain-containing protein [Roridomyces roridus]|uniref:mRNA 3'-end-processing protein RNA14 n=1 Tax=Roridomyces roridus TaxID=1738132 RepID=A0AAD7BEP3_9AGAR|nr:Suf-domain-containing protein [Roridomyces roridus]